MKTSTRIVATLLAVGALVGGTAAAASASVDVKSKAPVSYAR